MTHAEYAQFAREQLAAALPDWLYAYVPDWYINTSATINAWAEPYVLAALPFQFEIRVGIVASIVCAALICGYLEWRESQKSN